VQVPAGALFCRRCGVRRLCAIAYPLTPNLDYSWASDRAGRPCLAAASLPARMPAASARRPPPGTVPRGPR